MSLLSLPPELVELIATHLKPVDFVAVRSTCRELHDKVSMEFAIRVLNQQWLLRQESLTTIEQIASDERFTHKMTRLWIGTHDLFGWEDHEQVLPNRKQAWEAYMAIKTEQDAFRGSDGGSSALAATILKMPALRTIDIGEVSQTALRYGWGGNRIARLTGQILHPTKFGDTPRTDYLETLTWSTWDDQPEDLRTLAHHFIVVLLALAKTRQPISELSCLVSDSRDGMRGIDIMTLYHEFHTPIFFTGAEDEVYLGLKDALREVTKLRLALDYHDAEFLADDDTLQWLNRLVGLMPRVRHLALFFDGLDEMMMHSVDGAKNWYSSTYFVKETTLQCLVHLELGNATVQPSALRQFLTRHRRTLKHVSLRRLSLRNDWPRDHKGLSYYAPQNHQSNFWPGVLDILSSMSVTSIRLMCLYESAVRLTAFAPGIDNCVKCCKMYHEGKDYYEADCTHVAYRSDDGRIPEIFEHLEIYETDSMNRLCRRKRTI